jgi:hypothetical protein
MAKNFRSKLPVCLYVTVGHSSQFLAIFAQSGTISRDYAGSPHTGTGSLAEGFHRRLSTAFWCDGGKRSSFL